MSRKKKKIHFINPMTEVAGSELRVIELYRQLKDVADVTVWSEWDNVDPALAREVPIRPLRPRRGQFPLTGTLVFVGFWFHVGRWAWVSLAHRRIILCNTMPYRPRFLLERRRRISCGGLWPLEFAYAGAEVARAIGLPGPILPSPIDLQHFKPGTEPRSKAGFRVGRVSRDHLDKHHEGSPALYLRLIAAGCTVKIMGGTLLRKWIPDPPPGLELLPLCAEDNAAFIRGLDCFLYRTNDCWFETFGRVVFEALACGVPVVAHRRGGYAHFLRDGDDVLLFDTDEEAFNLVLRLKDDTALRARLSRNGRRRVEQMYSTTALAAVTQYFLNGDREQLDRESTAAPPANPSGVSDGIETTAS